MADLVASMCGIFILSQCVCVCFFFAETAERRNQFSSYVTFVVVVGWISNVTLLVSLSQSSKIRIVLLATMSIEGRS